MDEFLKLCREDFAITTNTSVDSTFIVWSCKTLQNKKALIGSVDSKKYFEYTHNGNKKETYVDVYIKEGNYKLPR